MNEKDVPRCVKGVSKISKVEVDIREYSKIRLVTPLIYVSDDRHIC